MNWRQALVTTHLIVGCASAPVLLVLGLTGAALVFEDEINSAANRSLARVEVTGAPLPVDSLERHVASAYPGFHLTGVWFSLAPTGSWLVSASPSVGDSSVSLLINPYSGQILGTEDQAPDVMRWVHLLHTRLMAGNAGQTVVGISALVLLFLTTSGLILWWRGKVFSIKWEGSKRRVMFDLHNTIGGVAWLFLGTFALTGAVVHWEGATSTWLGSLGHTQPIAPPPREAPTCTSGAALPIAQLISIAQAQVPGARITTIVEQNGTQAPVRTIFKFPEDHTPAGRTQVYLAPCSGQVLLVRNARAAPFSFRYTAMWNRMIHTGDIYGWPTRILAALMSLALPMLAITGPLIWWFRRKGRLQAD